MDSSKQNKYSDKEEKYNVISHGIGFVLSVIALILMLVTSLKNGGPRHIISAFVFGLSLLMLYAASTLYHNTKKEKLRARLNIFDHASIYVLIAGTYTPFLLISLNNTLGYRLFGLIWVIALAGIIIKLFYFGKYKILSTIMYVLMGWIIVLVINPLAEVVADNGIYWLFAGGIAYTIGAVLFSLNKLKMNHAVFHIFVLLGSIFHFISIYWYVLPN